MKRDKTFNINIMLKRVFEALETTYKDKTPNLIFYFSKGVPAEMKGSSSILYFVILKMIQHLIQKDKLEEILISIDAPEEFLYKEPVSFKITNISIREEELMPSLIESIEDDLKLLDDATITYSENNGGSIELTTQLTTSELGCRRHYRMPSKDMLNKNILLVIKGNNLALSLTKMFKYFPMNIDISISKYKDKFTMSRYDLILIEDTLLDNELDKLINKTINNHNTQFVLIGNKNTNYNIDNPMIFLEKPVTQGSVYNLLIEVFNNTENE